MILFKVLLAIAILLMSPVPLTADLYLSVSSSPDADLAALWFESGIRSRWTKLTGNSLLVHPGGELPGPMPILISAVMVPIDDETNNKRLGYTMSVVLFLFAPSVVQYSTHWVIVAGPIKKEVLQDGRSVADGVYRELRNLRDRARIIES